MKQLFLMMACGLLSAAHLSFAAVEALPASAVYMVRDITPENVQRLYAALGREATGRVGVKIHMGEPGGTNYLRPELVGAFVQSLNGTFIDANTAYKGRRTTAEDHLKVAEEHGFAAIAPVDILDAEGELPLPVAGGRHLQEVVVGAHFKDYDSIVVLTHFKGHAMGGFGGAIKNISIGIASIAGKCLIHTAGKSRTSPWGRTEQTDFLEAMAEGAKGMVDALNGRFVFINVMNNLSVDCDCDANASSPVMADIGMLASLDPVALDRACVDMVYASTDHGRRHLVDRIESKQGTHLLDYAEQIGLGRRAYDLIMLD